MNAPQCKTSRYRTDKVTKKVPHKVLHYILTIPHLQWLFRCQSIAQFMDFHAKNRIQDNVLWITVDGYAFRYIKEKWPIFKEEPHNVKLSLAADGVNPFGELHSTYSVWPVLLAQGHCWVWLSLMSKEVINDERSVDMACVMRLKNTCWCPNFSWCHCYIVVVVCNSMIICGFWLSVEKFP